MEDFEKALEDWKVERTVPHEVAHKDFKKCNSHVELSDEQKRFVIEYYLNGSSKGLFEDTEIFGDEDLYEAYRNAVDDFIDKIKQHLLDTI